MAFEGGPRLISCLLSVTKSMLAKDCKKVEKRAVYVNGSSVTSQVIPFNKLDFI